MSSSSEITAYHGLLHAGLVYCLACADNMQLQGDRLEMTDDKAREIVCSRCGEPLLKEDNVHWLCDQMDNQI